MRIFPGLAVVLVVVALTGCGSQTITRTVTAATPGAQTATQPARKPMTRSEFVAAADRICAANQRRIAPLTRGLPTTMTPAAYQTLADDASRAQAIDAKNIAQLRGLPEPASDRIAIARVLHAAEHQTALLTPLIDALRDENLGSTVSAEENLEQAQGVSTGLAEAFGLTTCAKQTS